MCNNKEYKFNKDCRGCGEEFQTNRSSQVWCTHECRLATRNEYRKSLPNIYVEEKKCGGCKVVKSRHAFSANQKMADGLKSQCNVCMSEHNKRGYDNSREDLRSFVSMKYSSVKKRCTNPNLKGAKYYYGLPLCSKEEFIEFAMESEELKVLFEEWVASAEDPKDRVYKLVPSIDRIYPNLGYTLNNMQWITHSENSRRGAMHKHHGIII